MLPQSMHRTVRIGHPPSSPPWELSRGSRDASPNRALPQRWGRIAKSGGLHVQSVTYVTFASDCAVTGMGTTLGDKLVEHHQDGSS